MVESLSIRCDLNCSNLFSSPRITCCAHERGGREHLVCSLLLGGACPSAKDKKGDAPLHLAAWRGRAGIASALLLKGGDKNALDSLGRVRTLGGGAPLALL